MTPNESPAALLPCPFCGSEDVFCERSDFTSAYILCNNCLARGPEALQESDDEETPGEASARKAWNRRASTAPAASESRGSVPDGFVLVPKWATEDMWEAAYRWQREAYVADPLGARYRFYDGIYQAMLAAAPTPPAVSNGEPPDWAIAQAVREIDHGHMDGPEGPEFTKGWATCIKTLLSRANVLAKSELARSAAAKGEG